MKTTFSVGDRVLFDIDSVYRLWGAGGDWVEGVITEAFEDGYEIEYLNDRNEFAIINKRAEHVIYDMTESDVDVLVDL